MGRGRLVNGRGTAAESHGYTWRDGALPFGAEAVRYRLTQVDLDGQRTVAGEVEAEIGAPAVFRLHAPFPNPTRGAAKLRYELPGAERVVVTLFNTLGQEVARLVDREHEAGRYEVTLDTGRFAPGLYVVRYTAGSSAATRKVSLVR